MISYIENKEKRKGLIGTILFHLILLVIFIFFGLTYIHPPEEFGVQVDFGNSEQGMGQVENEQPTAETQEEETPAVQTPTEPVISEQDVTTQEIEETVTVQKKEEKKETKKTETVQKQVQTPSNKLLEAMNKNNSTEASQASSEGNKSGVGNMGRPDGEPNGDPSGGGAGGLEFNLAGRRWVQKPNLKNNSQEFGTIVVSITVDKYGNVTKATGGAKGSTTASAHLTKLAEEAAYKAKFTANPDAAEEQFGTITIRFTPR